VKKAPNAMPMPWIQKSVTAAAKLRDPGCTSVALWCDIRVLAETAYFGVYSADVGEFHCSTVEVFDLRGWWAKVGPWRSF
jgi:hypothetical protein